MKKQKSIKIIIRIIIILLAVSLIAWVVNKNEAIVGSWVKIYSFDEDNRFISRLYPNENLVYPEKTSEGDTFQAITGSPVHFEVKLKKDFQHGKIKIKYRNPDNQFAKLGFLTNVDRQTYDWRNIASEYTVPSPEQLLGSNRGGLNLTTRLRGYHQMETMVEPGRDLNFVFDIIDLNRGHGPDEVKLIARQGGELVAEVYLPDDGDTAKSGKMSEIRQMQLLWPQAEGIYELEFVANNDIVIDRIISKQSQLLFKNKIHLAEDFSGLPDKISISRPVRLNVLADYLSLYTSHRESLQTVRINSKVFKIDQVLKYFTADLGGSSWTKFSSPTGDLLLETDGYFSFELTKVSQIADQARNDDVGEGGLRTTDSGFQANWQTAEFDFTITPDNYFSYGGFDRLIFTLWIPELNLSDSRFEVSEVTIDFK